MKVVKCLFFVLLPSLLQAQRPQISGFVTEQNSGKKRVPGVLVKAAAPARTNQVNTSADGSFSLVFQDMPQGAGVQMQAQKTNWVIVNQQEMYTGIPENGSREAFKIIMSTAQKLEQAQKEYHAITDAAIKRGYEKKMAELKFSRAEVQQKAIQLEKQRKVLLNDVQKIADEYSRINIDDLTEIEKQALNLFRQGRIEEAIAVRNQMSSEEKLKAAIRNRKELDSIIELHTRNLRTLAREYSLLFDFDNADRIYSKLADADTTNVDNTLIYAEFLLKQNRFNKAIELNVQALRNSRGNPVASIYIGNNLASVYIQQNDLENAEKTLMKSLNICNRFKQLIPQLYEAYASTIWVNLSMLYDKKKDYAAEEKAIGNALEATPVITNENRDVYSEIVGNINHAAGIFYLKRKRYNEAIKAFESSLRAYALQKNESGRLPEANIASVHGSLAELYNKHQNFDKAAGSYEQSKNILESLASNNPGEYLPYLAKTYLNMASFYREKNQFSNAEIYQQKALNSYQRLVAIDKNVYEPEMMVCKRSFGDLYKAKKNFDLAERYYLEALNYFLNPGPFGTPPDERQIAFSHNNLGALYQEMQRYPEAERQYSAAIHLYRKLARENKEQFEPVLAMMHLNKANILMGLNAFEPAGKNIDTAAQIWQKLYLLNNDEYEPSLAAVHSTRAGLLVKMQNYQEAAVPALEALNRYKTLYAKDEVANAPGYARALITYGQVQMQLNQFAEAEQKLEEGVRLWKKLIAKDNGIYEPELVVALDNLVLLYIKTKKLDEAAIMVKEYDRIARKLVAKDQTFDPWLANAQKMQGDLYMEKKDFERAETAYLACAEIKKRLAANKNITITDEEIAEINSKLANLYISMNNGTKAEQYMNNTLETLRRLVAQNEIHYGNLCAFALNLCSIYGNSQNTAKINLGRSLLKEVESYLPKIKDESLRAQLTQFHAQMNANYKMLRVQAP